MSQRLHLNALKKAIASHEPMHASQVHYLNAEEATTALMP
jgi:hypothetical protein